MNCPICDRRKPARQCPARGDAICTICCGQERELSLDCPHDCIYLLRAREQEEAHRQSVPPGELPFPGVVLPTGVLDLNRALVAALGTTILGFLAEAPRLNDADVAASLHALAETYRTLTSGLIYEKPPQGGPARELYAKLRDAVQELKKEQLARAALPVAKDSDVLYITVFLARVLRARSNGRPRCRAFLDFLRAQFPQAAPAERDAPRIIVP
ncbi:MAG TPA: hypothetical protein VLW54_03550 [Candidatus Acidoferrales bacterium]|nr:hypothetical protein [Candidatus Acidoferrales bacterium]